MIFKFQFRTPFDTFPTRFPLHIEHHSPFSCLTTKSCSSPIARNPNASHAFRRTVVHSHAHETIPHRIVRNFASEHLARVCALVKGLRSTIRFINQLPVYMRQPICRSLNAPSDAQHPQSFASMCCTLPNGIYDVHIICVMLGADLGRGVSAHNGRNAATGISTASDMALICTQPARVGFVHNVRSVSYANCVCVVCEQVTECHAHSLPVSTVRQHIWTCCRCWLSR